MLKILKCLDYVSIPKLISFLFKLANIKKTQLTYDFSVLNISEEDEISKILSDIAKFSGILEETHEEEEPKEDAKNPNDDETENIIIDDDSYSYSLDNYNIYYQ